MMKNKTVTGMTRITLDSSTVWDFDQMTVGKMKEYLSQFEDTDIVDIDARFYYDGDDETLINIKREVTT